MTQPEMRIDCAWCGDTIRDGVPPISHGICATCEVAFARDAGLTDTMGESIP